MVNDHSDSQRRNPLLPLHGLLFSISTYSDLSRIFCQGPMSYGLGKISAIFLLCKLTKEL